MGRKEDPDRVAIGDLSATPYRQRKRPRKVPEDWRYWRIRRLSNRELAGSGWFPSRAAVEAEVVRLQGTSPRSKADVPVVVRTVGDLLDEWTRAQRQRQKSGEIAERSLTNYLQAVAYWKDPEGLRDVLISALTRELVEDTIRSWRTDDPPVAPRTCVLAADVLRAAVRWGSQRGHCALVGLRDLQSEAVEDDEFVNCGYTPIRDELDLVLATIPPGRDHDLCRMLDLTGARIGEVAALPIRAWDRHAGELLISGRDRRRKRRGKVRTRRWPVLADLGGLLERLCADRGPDERIVAGLPNHVSDLGCDVLARACDRAGVERFTPHAIRRRVAMELLEQADAKHVAALTGHSVATLMRSYVRPRPEDIRSVVARAAASRKRGKVIAMRSGTNPGNHEEE